MGMFYKWGAGLDPDHPVIDHAYDEFLVTDAGDEIIDAAAGASVVNLGHALPGVADAVAEQIDRVAYLSTSYFTAEPVETLAGKLCDMSPSGLGAAFLSTSGSEAVETALKLARAYHAARGNDDKHTVISRWQSFHGATLGALGISGNTKRRSLYKPMFRDGPHIGPAYPYRWGYEGRPEEQAVKAASELEAVVRREGPETVAAFVAEPITGSSIPAARPHPAYYREVRRICDEYDVLFIADEVMTGFGRTGEMFAVDHFDVVPDLLALGKGISAGYAPISATLVHERIADALTDANSGFYHGHTYSGHVASCAVGAHVVDRYTDELLVAANQRGARLVEALEPIADHPHVGEIRRAGLMIGVEFVADRDTKAPFDPVENVKGRVFERALEGGVYLYPGSGSVDGQAGDHVMIAPPLTVSEASVDAIGSTVVDVVESVLSSTHD